MSDEMLSEFRSDIEQHTLLPEFDDVMSRGRRRRRRLRFGTSVGTIAAIVVLLPAVVLAGLFLSQGSDRPSVVQISIATGPGDNDGSTTSVVTPAPRHKIVAKLIAAGGVDFAHAYGLIDACEDTTCSLQLIELSTRPSTERIDLLRSDPSQGVDNTRLVALDNIDVMVSADVGDGIAPQYQTLNNLAAGPAKGVVSASETVDPVQTAAGGTIGVVVNGDAKVRSIPRQPALTSPNLTSTVNGWWVTGSDPQTGELCVAVSRDRGITWQTTSLGVISDDHTPSLATRDGRSVYVLVHSAGQMLLIRSTDGGLTWGQPRVESAWNTYPRYGVLTPPDGSVGVWLSPTADVAASVNAIIYRRSTDGGTSFTSVVGSSAPNGQVVSLPGGYVTLGTKPALSADARTWTTIALPVIPPG
jgi:hypothetical protein